MTRSRHILTVNVEDYFHVGALGPAIPRRHWPRFEPRVERNTLASLDLLDHHDQRATFFVVGRVAEAMPDLVREIASRGHEVAAKGYDPRTARELGEAGFREDAVRSRDAVQTALGQQVLGFRAARGWLGLKDGWALDILAEEGFAYDASLRPLGWGVPAAVARPHARRHAGRTLWELPLSSVRLAGFSLPIAGGNYMRQLPHGTMRRLADDWAAGDAPLMSFFHVWELDAEQPRIATAGRLERLRHYRNLSIMPQRIADYLSHYRFAPAADHLGLTAAPIAIPPANGPAAAAALQTGERRDMTLVVPCFNEEASLGYLANTLRSFAAAHPQFALSYVFVDDGSRDATLARLQTTFGGWPNTQIVAHPANRGVAAATLTGIAAARDETVAVIDCDCTYDPDHLAVMVPMLAPGVALVTASPYHKAGRVLNVPGWRLFLSRGLSWLYRRKLRTKLATYTACFRVYRRSAVLELGVTNGGFLGIVEILEALDRRGMTIVECPAVLESRMLGRSKMKVVRTIVAHLRFLARLSAARPSALRSTVRELAE